MRRILGALALVLVTTCGGDDPDTSCARFLQWGGDPGHSGAMCVAGQPMERTLERIEMDPFAEEEVLDGFGALLIHYQAPLIVGDDVYLMFKSGSYTPCDRETLACEPYYRNTQVWNEKGYRWESGRLVEKWTFASDWKPEPTIRFEPMFHPAIAGDFIYVPGLGGSVFKVDRATGLPVSRIAPFGEPLDPDLYVAGAVSADTAGNVYYTALKLDHDDPYGRDASGWLVHVRPDDSFATVSTTDLATGAPAATDMCRSQFAASVPRPLPPEDDAGGAVLAPEVPCGAQRPAMNLAPALAPDGTIYLVTRAHFVDRTAFLVAVRPDLTTRWARSLSRILDDGCGVTVPTDGSAERPGACRPGARAGVDPLTNEPPSARASDSSSSAPVVLPDGSVLYGAFTSYNGSRGHLLKLDAAGVVVATHDFGWDVTPAVYRHDGTYSIIIKNNSYGRDAEGVPLGPFYIEQLSKDLTSEWRFQLTNTQSCTRLPNGDIECVEDHPNGFEWCINAPLVDREGTVYATGEDGNAYAIGQGGIERHRVFLEMAIGAAYTPLALDGEGRIYTLNDGKLKVLGR